VGEDRQDRQGHSSTERVSVPQAADHLGTTVDAIRKRVQRRTIPHERDSDGRVWILLDTGRPRQDTVQDTGKPQSDSAALISEMRAHNATLQAQLEAERQAHAEARRLLMAALERIPPAIEPPSEPRESPETATNASEGVEPRPSTEGAHSEAEGAQLRSRRWWRRIIGG
jgi:CelD/BcsL family acetyltransferase involved in cellulose biosynthesis